MSAPFAKCNLCFADVEPGTFPVHNKICPGLTNKGGDGAVSSAVVPPKICRDCGKTFSGNFSVHRSKCSSQIAKANDGPEKSAAPVGGGGGNNSKGSKVLQNSSAAVPIGGGHEGPATPAPVGGGGGKKPKAPKGSDDSSATAPVGGGGQAVSVPPLVGGGGGKNSKGPKVPENPSAAASSVGGGAKGPAKAVDVVERNLIPITIALKKSEFTFVNRNGEVTLNHKVCGHMVSGDYICTIPTCSAKLVNGGCCFTTATRILFAVVEPKTPTHDRAFWREPTAIEISLLKMPVAATAAADV